MKHCTHQITPKHIFAGYDGKLGKKKSEEIFKDLLYLIIDDIVDNNITFKTPSPVQSYLSLEKIGGEKLQQERQQGRHKELDLIKSKFTAANINMSYFVSKHWEHVRWSLPKEYRLKINENIYNGKY